MSYTVGCWELKSSQQDLKKQKYTSYTVGSWEPESSQQDLKKQKKQKITNRGTEVGNILLRGLRLTGPTG